LRATAYPASLQLNHEPDVVTLQGIGRFRVIMGLLTGRPLSTACIRWGRWHPAGQIDMIL